MFRALPQVSLAAFERIIRPIYRFFEGYPECKSLRLNGCLPMSIAVVISFSSPASDGRTDHDLELGY